MLGLIKVRVEQLESICRELIHDAGLVMLSVSCLLWYVQVGYSFFFFIFDHVGVHSSVWIL